MNDALRRTVTRFSNERKAEIQFGLTGDDLGSAPMFVFKAAVVGAGVMGGEIAQVIAAADIPVLLKDVDQKFVDAGLAKAREVTEKQVGKLVAKEKLTAEQGAEQVEATLARITGTTSYDGFGDVDFVIEAVPERMEVKHARLRRARRGHARPRDPRLQHLRPVDHRDRRRHQPARQGRRLPLLLARLGDAPDRDRRGRGHLRRRRCRAPPTSPRRSARRRCAAPSAPASSSTGSSPRRRRRSGATRTRRGASPEEVDAHVKRAGRGCRWVRSGSPT